MLGEREGEVSTTQREHLNIMKHIMKSIRKTEQIRGRHKVRLKQRVKFANVHLENVDGQNMF